MMVFFFRYRASSVFYTLSLHDALPISGVEPLPVFLQRTLIDRLNLYLSLMQILLGDFPLDFCRLRMSLLGKEEKGDTDSYLETVKAGLPRYFLKSILHIKGGQKVGFRHSVPGICYIYLPAFIIKQGMIF